MAHRVTATLPLPAARLLLTFSNGEQRIFDVAPYLDKGIFTQLKDPQYFSRVRVVAGHVEWPNQQDFSPDTLYLRSVPVLPGKDLANAA
jgi:hypothetical protein